MRAFSFSNISIQKRLPLLISILVLLILVIFVWTSYYSVKQVSLEAGNQRLKALTEQFGSLFRQSTQFFLTSAGTTAANNNLQAFIKTGDQREETISLLNKLGPAIDTLCLVVELRNLRKERILATSDFTVPAEPDSEFLYSTLIPGNVLPTRFYQMGDSTYWGTIAAVMENEKPIGFLIKWRLILASSQVAGQLSKLLGANASLYIGNIDNSLWTNLARVVSPPPDSVIGRNDVIEYQRIKGETLIASAIPVPGTKWAVLIELSKDTILQPSKEFLQNLILIGIALLLLGVLAVWITSRSITKPLHRLTTAASEIALGRYSTYVEITQKDELGRLGQAFNSMIDEVKNSQSVLEKKVYDRTQQLRTVNTELTELNQKLQEIDELKTRFFTNVSHELRTPLALILGPLEKLLSGTLPTDQNYKHLNVIQKNARILLRQVNNLLDLSKLEVGKITPVYTYFDLGSLFNRTASYFESVAHEKGITYNISFEDNLFIEADPEKLERIFINLLTNAFKFTPEDGIINFKVTRNGDNAVFYVEDSGSGLSDEIKRSMFQRFSQTANSASWRFGSSGLGLSIVKEFIELHKGKISVDSSPLGGALFIASIPIKAPTGTEVSTDTEDFPVGKAEPTISDEVKATLAIDEDYNEELPVNENVGPDAPFVLVVEDNSEMNRFITEILSEHYNVISARNGKEGLLKALESKPDLIITDIMMPEMSGDQLIDELKKHSATESIPVIFLTAKADELFKIELLNKGVSDYLSKPFIVDELKARVNNILSLKVVKDYLQRELNTRNNNMEQLVHQLAEKKDLLESSLKEKEVLFKEIHHRVKNNLQIISSLLNLQVAALQDPAIIDMFKNSQNRIKSMALIHEKLYRSDSILRIDFYEYVDELSRNLIVTYYINPGYVNVKLDIDNFSINMDLAVSLGLILTELISNSIKHAFAKQPRPEIYIAGKCIDNNSAYQLEIKDNGIGLKEHSTISEIQTLGLQLVNTLIEQIDGTLVLDGKNGTRFLITFPLRD